MIGQIAVLRTDKERLIARIKRDEAGAKKLRRDLHTESEARAKAG